MPWIHTKNPSVTLLFVDFSKAFDSKHGGKMEQVLLEYDLSKENITALICFTKTWKQWFVHLMVSPTYLTVSIESFKEKHLHDRYF